MASSSNPAPIPFLTSDANGRFSVSEEALGILEGVKAPLAVVVSN